MRDGATALAQARSETTIEVELPGRSYAIVIGEHLLASSGQCIATALPGARVAVVTDANVAALHLPQLKASLDKNNKPTKKTVVRKISSQLCRRTAR
jgi:3-dehydroquinate synthetase